VGRRANAGLKVRRVNPDDGPIVEVFVVVRREPDGAKGSPEFQHNPRFYVNFQPDQ
jgi:hypothetical protein